MAETSKRGVLFAIWLFAAPGLSAQEGYDFPVVKPPGSSVYEDPAARWRAANDLLRKARAKGKAHAVGVLLYRLGELSETYLHDPAKARHYYDYALEVNRGLAVNRLAEGEDLVRRNIDAACRLRETLKGPADGKACRQDGEAFLAERLKLFSGEAFPAARPPSATPEKDESQAQAIDHLAEDALEIGDVREGLRLLHASIRRAREEKGTFELTPWLLIAALAADEGDAELRLKTRSALKEPYERICPSLKNKQHENWSCLGGYWDTYMLGLMADHNSLDRLAEDLFAQAVEEVRRGPTPHHGDAYMEIADDLADTRNRTGLAINFLEAALERERLPRTLSRLARLWSDVGDFSKAERLGKEAIAAAEKAGNGKVPMRYYQDLGRTYGDWNDPEEAGRYLTKALELARAGGDKQDIANVLNDLAAQAYVDDFDKSVATFNEAIRFGSQAYADMEKEILPEQKEEVREAMNIDAVTNLAYTYVENGHLEEARALLEKIGQEKFLGFYNLKTGNCEASRGYYQEGIPQDERSGRLTDQLADYSGLGLSLECLGKRDEAASAFRKGQELLERVRDTLDEDRRLIFLTDNDWKLPRLTPHQGIVRVAPFLSEGLRGSLYASEFAKARVFAEAAARHYGTPETRLPDDVATEEKKLRAEIAENARRRERAFKDDDKAELARLGTRRGKLKEREAAFVADLRRRFPEYAAALYPQPVHMEEIPLQSDEVLLEFAVTEPYSKAFVVKGGTVAFSYDVPLRDKELADLVRRYRGFFEGISDTAQLAAYDPKLGRRLFELLLKPAFEALGPGGSKLVAKSARLTVVPDGILGILPFESLVTSLPALAQMPSGRHGPVPAGVRYVADDYDIAYAQSATALANERKRARRARPRRALLVVADPIFSPADSRFKSAGPDSLTTERRELDGTVVRAMGIGGARAARSARRTIGSEEDFLFPRLFRTSVLARELQKKVFAGQAAKALIGADASEERVKGEDLSVYKYIVFATHGILADQAPGIHQPALVLSQVGGDPGQDGFLTMSEIMGLKLGADVVALTACQTGLGRRVSGEGVMGLGRAFQYAGAKSVLVSLWNVAEDSTTMLAERFFHYLRAGKTKRQALRLARGDIRHAGYEHPFYWAPFLLIGD